MERFNIVGWHSHTQTLSDAVISLRPKATKSFIGGRLGGTVPAHDIESLHQAFRIRALNSADFQRRFVGSKERISNFLRNLVQRQS
jgi:hypothetical protein